MGPSVATTAAPKAPAVQGAGLQHGHLAEFGQPRLGPKAVVGHRRVGEHTPISVARIVRVAPAVGNAAHPVPNMWDQLAVRMLVDEDLPRGFGLLGAVTEVRRPTRVPQGLGSFVGLRIGATESQHAPMRLEIVAVVVRKPGGHVHGVARVELLGKRRTSSS